MPTPAAAETPVASDAVAAYALGLGDDALILAQRLGEWIAHAPELEEDVALGNIALDLLGHARAFLTLRRLGLGQDRGRPRLLPRRARVPQPRGCSSSRTATSPTRSPASWSPPSTSARCTGGSRHPPTRRSPRSRPRRSRRSTTTATTPCSGCCGSALGTEESHRRMRRALERPLAVRRRAVPRRAADRATRRHRRASVDAARRVRCAVVAASRRGRARRCPRAPFLAAAAATAGTPSTSAAARRDAGARPRSIRGRHGDRCSRRERAAAPDGRRRRDAVGSRPRCRPGGSGAHDRGPRGAARRAPSTARRVDRADHARPTPAARPSTRSATTSCRARRGRVATSGCDDRARPGLDHRLDERGGQGASSRSTGSRAAGRAAPTAPIALRSRHPLPALRVAAHARALALRLDLVQGALRVPALPRALRPLQGALMTQRRSPRPPPRTPARRVFHPLTRGERAPADRRRDRGHASPFPTTLADEFDYAPGQYVAHPRRARRRRGAPQLLDLPRAVAGRAQGRDQARPRRRVLDLGASSTSPPGDVARGDEPGGHFTSPLGGLRRPAHFVGIAAGSGITPMMALIEHHLQERPRRHASPSSTRTAPRWTRCSSTSSPT